MTNPKTHSCCTCGYTFAHGANGSHSCSARLRTIMNEVLTRLKRSLGSKQEIAQYIADQLVIEIPFESAPIQATTPITFEQLYSFVKPTDPIELWSPENKRLAVLIATHQQSTVDDVVEIMKCGPCDWSSPEKAALAKKLGK